MDDLVSTDWLAQNLGQADVVVVDASWHMPATGRQRPRRISGRAHPRRSLPRHRRGRGHGQSCTAHASERRGLRSRHGATRRPAERSHRRLRQFGRRGTPRAAGSCSATSERSRSRFSTAASRNGSRKVARPKAGEPRSRQARFDAVERQGEVVGKRDVANGLGVADRRCPEPWPLRRYRGRSSAERRRRPHSRCPQPPVRGALQSGRHVQVARRTSVSCSRRHALTRRSRSSPAAVRE